MNDRTKLAGELRAAGAELDKDPNASMRDAMITIVYKPLTSKLETNIVCGNNSIT